MIEKISSPSETIILNVVIDDKYTVRQDLNGRVYALRYNEEWRDCVGDNLILAMAQKIEKLQEKIKNS